MTPSVNKRIYLERNSQCPQDFPRLDQKRNFRAIEREELLLVQVRFFVKHNLNAGKLPLWPIQQHLDALPSGSALAGYCNF